MFTQFSTHTRNYVCWGREDWRQTWELVSSSNSTIALSVLTVISLYSFIKWWFYFPFPPQMFLWWSNKIKFMNVLWSLTLYRCRYYYFIRLWHYAVELNWSVMELGISRYLLKIKKPGVKKDNLIPFLCYKIKTQEKA